MTTSLASPAPTTTTARPRVRDVVAVARPVFWPVSLVPFYLGVVLATEDLVPPVDTWWRLLVAAVVIGPLMWLAVLAVNDSHDLAGDSVNPRRTDSPLVAGRLTLEQVRWLARGAVVATLAGSLLVGWLFALGMAVSLVASWAYSAPPLRLKTRAGYDVGLNAIAVGAGGPLGGWVAIHDGLEGFPTALAVLATIVAAALYIPTVLADEQADREAGYRTIAVRMGQRATYEIGFALWSAAALLSVLLAATNTVIPRTMLWLEIVMVPLLVIGYRRVIVPGRRNLKGVMVLAAMFLVPCLTFVLLYTGVV